MNNYLNAIAAFWRWLWSMQQPKQPISTDLLFLIGDTGSGTISVVDITADKILYTFAGIFPSWTPDGRVIFSKSGQIYLANMDGTNLKQIGDLPLYIQPVKAQMGRNGIIVFAGATLNEGSFVYTIKENDLDAQKLVPGVGPSLAASGTWVSYTSTLEPHFEIWRINIDGTGKQQLTFNTDPDYPDANASHISPDETQIAIFSGKESTGPTQTPDTWGYRNVALISATGGPRKVLTPCKPVQFPGALCVAADDPTWWPDGTKVTFGTDRGGEWQVDTDGNNFKLFYKQSRGAAHVALRVK